MKVTILGIWGAYPEAEGSTSSFLIEEDNVRILVECGSGVLSQLQKYISIDQLDAIIISHYHQDHIADVGCLQYGLMINNQLNNRDKIFPIYGHNKDQQSFERLNYESVTLATPISEAEELTIGPFQISFIPTIHPVFGLAMKFTAKEKTVVYTSDTEWDESMIPFSKNADLIISEATLYNEQEAIRGHLTAGQAGELAVKANANRLILTHLPHHGNHQDLLQQAKKNFRRDIYLAAPGLYINI